MLPPFDEFGNLPAGIHPSKIDEIAQRFGCGSPERVVEIAELKEFVAWAWKAGVERIIVNGSFVTSRTAPNDVDVISCLVTTTLKASLHRPETNSTGRSCKSSSRPI